MSKLVRNLSVAVLTYSLSQAALCEVTKVLSVDATGLQITTDSKGQYIYIPDQKNNRLVIVDSISLSIEQDIELPTTPTDVAIDEENEKIYVTSSDFSGLYIFDLNTLQPEDSLSIPEAGHEIVIGNSDIFVTTFEYSNGVLRLDRSTGEYKDTFSENVFTYQKGAIEITPNKEKLVFANRGLSPGTVGVYDITGPTPVLLIRNGHGDLGSNGQALSIDPINGDFLSYAVGSGNGRDYSIAKIDIEDMSWQGEMLTGPYPRAVHYAVDGVTAFTNEIEGEVSVWNHLTYELTESFNVMGNPKDFVDTQNSSLLGVISDQEFAVYRVKEQLEPQELDQSLWNLFFVDSEEVNAENGAATNAFDGDRNTFWHTEWSNDSPTPPHEIQIDLGNTYEVSSLIYTPRQDGATNGRIGDYEIYVSLDGINWGAPIAAGSFENSNSAQTINFAPKAGKFIRLKALSEASGNNWTAIAELAVLGTPFSGNYAPEVTITTPTNDQFISLGDSVDFSATGNDTDGDYPLTYEWNFGEGSGIDNSTVQNPGNLQFNNTGTFEVGVTVTDSQGKSSSTPAQVTITVTDGTIPQLLDKSLWSLFYVDSEELVGENGAATNAFDGNVNTIWHTAWSESSPTHPHDIQINLGVLKELTSLFYTPRQDGGSNGRISGYEIYVSLDGNNWGAPVAAGVFNNSIDRQEVSFTPVEGQFIRLRSTSEVNGNPWTAVAEIDVFGK